MQKPVGAVFRKRSSTFKKRTTVRFEALVTFETPLIERDLFQFLELLESTSRIKPHYLADWEYDLFIGIRIVVYYLLPDKKRLLIIFGSPAGLGYDSYWLGVQFREVCSFVK